ncbi:hypothetical protein B0H13DRAFT_1906154 [Mycena leptocephala]|nr:hypothetical protein B0H13DRAFT_1906154 [Mycena leptocephala]
MQLPIPTDNDSDYGEADADFIALLAALDLADVSTEPPPRTPSPTPLRTVQRHTFPSIRSRTHTISPTERPTIYHFESPTRRGCTTEWSVAGSATQGVAHAHVHAVQTGARRQKTSKAAYVVFCGLRVGAFMTWRETSHLVTRVRNSIYRGYPSVAEAHAAFDYASARSWVRVSGAPAVAAIPQLPQPTHGADRTNPLNGNVSGSDRWYIVYHGITPGVYRSHLECQLNTLGVRGALHESVIGRSVALAKYAAAARGGNTRMAPPPRYNTTDVFS